MKRLVWITDLHLDDFNDQPVKEKLINSIKEVSPDFLAIAGDISSSITLEEDLKEFEKHLKIPILFVLGNHDYESTVETKIKIDETRQNMIKLTEKSKFLKWMHEYGIYKLTNNTCLIGIDGWPDGRYGNPKNKGGQIFNSIADFQNLSKSKIYAKMKELADESANSLQKILDNALKNYNHIFLITHIPPFIESCWYQRHQKTEEKFIPDFSCKAVGDVLLNTMKKNGDKFLTVLCGHTHGFGYSYIQSNLMTITGGLVRTQNKQVIGPQIQQIINII